MRRNILFDSMNVHGTQGVRDMRKSYRWVSYIQAEYMIMKQMIHDDATV